MKKILNKVKTRISVIPIKNNLTEEIFLVPNQLSVLFTNDADYIINIDKIGIMIKYKYIPFYLKNIYKQKLKIEIRPKENFKADCQLQKLVEQYGNSRFFIIKIWTNIGLIKSNPILLSKFINSNLLLESKIHFFLKE